MERGKDMASTRNHKQLPAWAVVALAVISFAELALIVLYS
jgi:hypothetical protein